MSLVQGYFSLKALAVLIPLQEKGLAPLAGLLVTLVLILMGAIANRKGDRPYQEKDKSFYWHRTPKSSSLCRGGFVIGRRAAVFLSSLLLEKVSGMDAILRGSVN